MKESEVNSTRNQPQLLNQFAVSLFELSSTEKYQRRFSLCMKVVREC